ncbi:PstS family phosphate ABC transporter substrate-binding protein [Aquibacillus rhizosphaerae]|uniref:Substrate-binding domain-containing protein n=1 Tax=Aquibacillus rhizosphaerae TaxID=3051431 RepID=A0ABT7L1C3_9BACI|nr:substrate-binding domain-containing protein [Aquibacillus sp. LR5S19]MDL4839649.1 substrate-binding domain-containing protein [Aquibacillus sp. LR5S19]
MKKIEAIFAIIGTTIAFGFSGFVIIIFSTIMGGAEFYTPLIIVTLIGLYVFSLLRIFKQMKKRIAKRTMLVFFSCIVISVIFYESYQYYLNSLEIMSSQDFDLEEYLPYKEDTKAVYIEEESSFTIEENLPLLDGATALYPVYSAFVQAVYPEKEYPLDDSEVVSSQTSNAFNNLVNGTVDMIFMAHPSEQQMRHAENNNVQLELTPIGREAFVFFVNTKNPIEELSMKEIQAIYSGEIKNWKQLGGDDEDIRAFQRPEGSGSQTALISVMNDTPLMDPPSKEIVSGMGGIIKETSNFQNRSNAIGFSFRHFSQDMVKNGKIKHIAVEGIIPSKNNIQNETYPIVDNFYAITANSDNPHLENFLIWILSEQGQQIIDETGYVPVR